jgi:CubicO group peptidase (beta-lactamase class C family)
MRSCAIALGLFLVVRAAVAAGDSLPPLPAQPDGVPWPREEWPQAEPDPRLDRRLLAERSEALFRPTGRAGLPDTRALLVVQGGRIVLERYATGFTSETRFVSWSMAKSVTQALVGILVREGRLALDAPAPVPEWRSDGDPRGAITLDQLLHMTSGIANGDGAPVGASSLGLELLFGRGSLDSAAFAGSFPLAVSPGTHWDYSTSTSVLLAAIVGRASGGGRESTARFIRRELFDPLGMRSAVPEFDLAGTFLGGSSVWATARDWARFGLLYLRDGRFEDRRILPEGWVDYTRTAARGADHAGYGAHFWLNRDPVDHGAPQLPGAPESAFSASGANGQFVTIVPTLDLVAVRLGEAQGMTEDEVGKGLGALIQLFPPPEEE